MKMSKISFAVMMALVALTQVANAKSEYRELTYVGAGRYTCEGNCEKFNREQKDRNRDIDTLQRYQRENRQDNQRIIDELKKGNAND